MSGIHIPVTADIKNFVDGMNTVKKSVKSTMDEVEESGHTIEETFVRIKNAAALTFAGFSGAKLIKDIANVRGEFQQLEVAFSTMLGSEEKATDLMNQLVKTAAITPFDLKGVADGAKSLMAYGTAAEDVNETLIRLGDIAAGMSIPLNDLVYLYGTTMVQGRMFTQDLRQFQGRGIPIAEELAKVLKTTKDQIPDLVTAGKVTSEVFNQAIVNMTSAGSKFGGLMEKQSKTILGQISNIEDAIDTMFNNIGKNSEGIINGALGVVSELVENYERVGKVLVGVVATYGTYKAAVMVVTALQTAQAAGLAALTTAETVHYGWLVLVQKAQALLNKTMLANPYVLAATAIAGITAALLTMKTQQDLVNDALEDYDNAKQDAIAKEEEHKRKIEELIGICQDEALSTDTRNAALVRLEQEYPNIFAKYDTEAEKLAHIRDIKKEIAALDGKSSITKIENEISSVEKRIKELESIRTDWFIDSAGNKVYTGRKRSDKEEAELIMLRNKRNNLGNQKRKADADSYFANLTGISNEDLQKQINERKNLLAKMKTDDKQYGKVNKGGATGVFTEKEIQGQIQILQGEVNKRKEPTYTPSELKAKAKKTLEDAKKALKDFDNQETKLTTAEAEATRKKLVDAVEEAEKAYKNKWGGTVKSGGKTDDTNKRLAAQKQEQWRYEDELTEIEKQALDAKEDARIAAIRNNAERERQEEEVEHKRRLREIQEQANEMKKAIYEHNKTVWENSHKDSPYELTEAGKAGWSSIQLPQDQQSIIDAREKKENEEYYRQVREQRQADLQSMRNYIQEYGTSLQQQLSIVEEYDEKIKNAGSGNKWETKRLEKERDMSLASVKANTLAMDIDWSQTFTSIGGVLEDIAKETYDKVKAYMESDDFKKLDANNKQAYSDLLKDLKSAGGLKKASWDELSKSINDYKRYVKEFKDATQSHEDAYKHYEEANKEYIDAIESGASATEIAIKERNKQEAEAVLEATGEVVKEIKDKMTGSGNTLTETNEALWKSLDNFENTINQITSGSLSGAVLGIGNLIKIIKGDSNIASRVGELFGATATKLGQVIEAILAILDTVGDDPSGFFEDLLNKIFDAIAGIIDDLGSGELARALSRGIFNGIMKVFDSIANNLSLKSGAFLGFGLVNTFRTEDDGKNSYGNVKQKYEDLVDIWDQLLEKKKEYLSMSWGNEAIQAEEDAQKLLEIEEERTKMMAKRRLGEGASSGSHSYWYRMWQGSYASKAEENKALNYVGSPYEGWISWGDVNEKIVRELYKEGLGAAQFNSMYDLVDMSAEQLAWIKENYAGLWASMDSDFRDYLEKLIEYGDQESEIFEKLQEQLTTTTEDNVFSQYLDYLYKFADGVEDVTGEVADDWQKMVNRMIINNIIGEMFRENLKKWYDKLYQANKALTETGDKDAYKEALEDLKEDYQSYIEQAQREIEQLSDLGIISATGENALNKDQSATMSAADKITYDQMEEFTGILTAVQIAGEQRLDVQKQILYTLQNMSGITSGDNSDFQEIRGLIGVSNDYLLDIKRSNREILEGFSTKIDKIINQLNNI